MRLQDHTILITGEEWVFRLALPYYGQAQGLDLGVTLLISNALFAVMHWFTLRWKWYWCVAAFVGGLALSRNFHQHFDLVLVIGIHWVATYVHTPRPPGRAGRRRRVSLSSDAYEDADARLRFTRELRREIAGLPGVESVGAMEVLPM